MRRGFAAPSFATSRIRSDQAEAQGGTVVQEVDAVVHLLVGVRVAIHPLLGGRCEMEFFLVDLSISVTVAINRTTKGY